MSGSGPGAMAAVGGRAEFGAGRLKEDEWEITGPLIARSAAARIIGGEIDREKNRSTPHAKEHIMAWNTPKIVEIAVGLEINSYACAEV